MQIYHLCFPLRTRARSRVPLGRIWLVLLATFALLVIHACERPTESRMPATGKLVVNANVSGTAVSTLVVEVSASDIPTPYIFNFTAVDGTASGTITVPAGQARMLTVHGYDTNGVETHRGQQLIDVQPGTNNPSTTVTLLPLDGEVPITVVVGSYRVVVNPVSFTLAVGATTTLSATVLDPENNVVPVQASELQWATTNPAIAKVDASGVVTAVVAGGTTIVVVFRGVAAITNVTVTDASGSVVAATVAIDPSVASVNVGSALELNATARDASGATIIGHATTWTSSDNTVASVSSSGVVSGIKAGSVTITAVVDTAHGSATISVTVPPPPPPELATTVSISPPSTSIAVGASTQLTAIARDRNNTVLTGHSVTWSSSDNTIATVTSSGVVSGVNAGSATITAVVDTAHGTSAITVTTAPPPPGDPVVVGAGDIASCDSNGDEQTALLLDNIAGTVMTFGDNAYDSGLASEFANCYDPTWGRHKARTHPSMGNHETYGTSDASGYYDYFGAAAGPRGLGYYSYDVGSWHVVVINNMIDVSATSQQVAWLKADLAAHPAKCTLAYWHYPRFSSGDHGNSTEMKPIWDVLYASGVDLVLNGHDHDYERFAPQDPNGVADPLNGIREFVVGTGGASYYTFSSVQPNSEVRHTGTFGVLKLTLHATSYDWQFVPVAGDTFTDSGSGNCH